MKKLLLLLLISALFFACKKEDHKSATCTTDVSSISGSYKVTAYTYKQSASSPETDYFNIIFSEACERDDILTFNSNGLWTLTDAGVVCSPAGDDNGAWTLSGNTMSIDGDPTIIESFDCKTLVLANTDVIITGDKSKITLTRQ
jgi:lipocalin-like protein